MHFNVFLFCIGAGITIAMLPFQNVISDVPLLESATAVSDPYMSIIACTAGCTGFAIAFGYIAFDVVTRLIKLASIKRTGR